MFIHRSQKLKYKNYLYMQKTTLKKGEYHVYCIRTCTYLKGIQLLNYNPRDNKDRPGNTYNGTTHLQLAAKWLYKVCFKPLNNNWKGIISGIGLDVHTSCTSGSQWVRILLRHVSVRNHHSKNYWSPNGIVLCQLIVLIIII